MIKYMGAADLIYLGVRRLLDPTSAVLHASRRQHRLGHAYIEGFVVNILNPKTALFFLAFLPQFVDSEQGSIGVQVLVLGMLFAMLGLMVGVGYAFAAGTAAHWLRGHPHSRIDTTQVEASIRPPQLKRAVSFYGEKAMKILTD